MLTVISLDPLASGNTPSRQALLSAERTSSSSQADVVSSTPTTTDSAAGPLPMTSVSSSSDSCESEKSRLGKINGDGIVDGADLAVGLGAWSDCLVPGFFRGPSFFRSAVGNGLE
jgi:hypothetical protein